MPELPEVETVRRVLSPQLQGRTIQTVTVTNPQVIAHEAFCQVLFFLYGRKISKQVT